MKGGEKEGKEREEKKELKCSMSMYLIPTRNVNMYCKPILRKKEEETEKKGISRKAVLPRTNRKQGQNHSQRERGEICPAETLPDQSHPSIPDSYAPPNEPRHLPKPT